MIKPTFLFYDYETFGKQPSLDKPAQFAAIRTDISFNLIEKPYLFYCKPPNDYLPQPEAVMINGITPQIALKYGIVEAYFARYVNRIFTKTPYTCIIGYNNLRFDDEFTRNIFYRNFYDPYSWGWQNGNSRLDLLDILKVCYVLRPEGIIWAKNEEGSTSFRLKKIAESNNICHKNAHDALSDVFATLEVAKLINKKQPKLFKFIFSYRYKKKLISLINFNQMTSLINITYNNKNNINLIVPIAWHPNNKNIIISVDLSSDITLLFNLDNNSLEEKILKKNDNKFKIPIKFIYINKNPILIPINVLRLEDIERLKINYDHCLFNLSLLRQNPLIKNKIINLFKKDIYYYSLKEDVDEQIYAGFFNEEDRKKINIIVNTKPNFLSKINFNFQDQRIDKLLFRYRARNFPNTLNQCEQKKWIKHKNIILNKEKIENFLLELKKLSFLNQDKKSKLDIIKDLYTYINKIIYCNYT